MPAFTPALGRRLTVSVLALAIAVAASIVVPPAAAQAVDDTRATISGTVFLDRGDGDREPDASAGVVFYDADSTLWSNLFVEADGSYSVSLAPGRYVLSFSSGDPELKDFVLAEYLGGGRSRSDAQILELNAGDVVTGVDATLDLGGQIEMWAMLQPAPGEPLVHWDALFYFQRLDPASGLYVPVPTPGFAHPVAAAPRSGPMEPGTYRVRAEATYYGSDPWDPEAPNPHYTGEWGNIVVRSGELTSVGALVLETDYYEQIPVFRFWSPTFQAHFYTADPVERDKIVTQWSRDWTYEGESFWAFGTEQAGTVPLYRFWSDAFKGHFYTADPAERDRVIATWPDTWSYEGIAYYVYPAGSTLPGTKPVYRFWGPAVRHHFYTASDPERDHVIARWPDVWSYEAERFRVPQH